MRKRRWKIDEGRLTQKKIIRHLSPVTGHGRHGFTLLETMIALLIVATAVITILHTVNYHAEVAYDHTLTTRMLLFAKEKIAEMETAPKNDKGVLPDTDFTYETIVKDIDYDEHQIGNNAITELKAVIRGQGKKIELSLFVLREKE